jgi:hypothetical protein
MTREAIDLLTPLSLKLSMATPIGTNDYGTLQRFGYGGTQRAVKTAGKWLAQTLYID